METNLKTNTLFKLASLGQSPWYDNIDRRYIKNGHLAELFDNGILGVTSNPTIFEKAVRASDIYDAEIKKLSEEGKKPLEIYDILVARDIGDAADLLKSTYERTNHRDGYVSIEVLPEFAHDPKKTIEYAKKIFKIINRPNVMIKVPGTKEAPEAIRALIAEGINVNATLLFSVKHYELSANAYIDGLKERLKDGKDIKNVFSVASVFVSRVDTWIDKILDDLKNEDLKGKIAVSNIKMIYQKFKEIFGDKFRSMKEKGGNIQRPLWASTSTKNRAYNDVKYVEELVGRDTINTIPPETINAFLDHGKPEITIEKDLDAAKSGLGKLKTLGVDIEKICQEIQDVGVESFQASFEKLIRSIEQKI